MKEIIVDQFGYKQFLDELENLKQISLKNSSAGSQAYNDAVGDGWHDNFAFEETMRESRLIASKIDNMLKEQKYIKVITPPSLNEEFINIGDILVLEMKYAEDDIENIKVKLTGNYSPKANLENDIQEITLNSPLGKAIYKKNINDKNINYVVQNKKIDIKIIEKMNFRK